MQARMKGFLETALTSLPAVGRTDLQPLESLGEALLANDARLVLVGIGKSGWLCRRLTATAWSMGLDAIALDSMDALHGDMGMLRDSDVIVLLSKSGGSPELVVLADELEQHGYAVNVVTNTEDSPLSTHGATRHTVVIPCPQEMDNRVPVPNLSLAATGLVLDALLLAVAMETTKPEDLRTFFLNHHPGGAIPR